MQRLDRHLVPLALPALLVLAPACGGDDDPTTPDAGTPVDMGTPDMGTPDMGGNVGNIVDEAQSAGLTDLVQAATTAGLADLLATGGPFTVFAPTNAAFSALGSSAPSDPELLANVLLHHVVAGEQDSTAVLAASSFTSAAGTTLEVDASASPPTIDSAPLGGPLDVATTNGIVHVIDAVMIPPTIVEAVSATDDLSSLETAVGAASASVQAALTATSAITVFAPVNSAFAGIDLDGLTQAQVDAILTYHVVSGQTLAGDLDDGQVLTTANGADLTVNVSAEGAVSLTDASGATVNVTSPDLRLLNGTVHLIDGVLNPEPAASDNIVQLAEQAGLNTLLTAATDAGLRSTLADDGPFTVFAPTDAAFQGVSLPADTDLLANVLLNHVVPGRLGSDAVLAATTLTTAANTEIAVDTAADPVTVGGAPLSTTIDQGATNGIVHVVDGVIVPPTIAEAANALPNLSTLNAAVGAADPAVGTTLAGAGPITVFAPVDAAFGSVDVSALLADPDRLTNILTYHVATGQALSTGLDDGDVLTMANGATLTVNEDAAGAISLTDGLGQTVNVIQADIRLLNGTVHLVDGVLNPGDLYEQAAAAGLSTLVAAVDRVDLGPALRGPGPLTVFGPTDTAFGALGVDLAGVDGDVVANILLHHVVPGRNDSTQVLAASSLTSLANLVLDVDATASPPTVGGARLSSTLDVDAANGIAHVLDDVIVPPTIVDVAQATPALSSVVQALLAASPGTLAAVSPDTLDGDAPITVFAPVDAAFTAQGIDPTGTPQAVLDAVLAYHVIEGQVLSTDLVVGTQTVPTLTGASLTVTVDASGAITITDGANGTGTVDGTLRDIRTLTGVVHVIDRVLQPE